MRKNSGQAGDRKKEEVKHAAPVSETDEFVSCDDGAENKFMSKKAMKAMELDIASINVDVNGPTGPQSVKADVAANLKNKVPGLNLGEMFKRSHTDVQTPSSRREPIHLETLQESDYDENSMNKGQMATTNLSHDSADLRDAEDKFKRMMSGTAADEESDLQIEVVNPVAIQDDPSGDESEVTHQVANKAAQDRPEGESVFDKAQPAEESKSLFGKDGEGETRGQNLVVDDQHRNTAIELFENYFARAYRRKDNAPMTKKRFLKRIENARRREMLDDDYVRKFEQLFNDAKKDDQGRVSAENLIDAIVIMLKTEDELEDQAESADKNSAKGQQSTDLQATQNRLRERANKVSSNPWAKLSQDEISGELLRLFDSHEKTFYAQTGARENNLHINLQDLKERYSSFDNLLAEENQAVQKESMLFNLLLSVTPRGEMFIGKHGAGLMTLAEFTKVVEEALLSEQLCFKTYSAAFLDDSIDFGKGASLSIEQSASQLAPQLTDRNLREAMQQDAKRVVENFQVTYSDCEESSALTQVTEMLEYLVVENQHECLGVTPQSLQEMFDLLRDKTCAAKVDYDQLETQKNQFKEIELLRQHCQEIEDDRDRLATYEQSFIEAQNEIKQLQQNLQKAETESQRMLPILEANESLKNEIQTLQICIDEKEFKIKSLGQDLQMAHRQLERLEDQNRVFDESLSSESEEEAKMRSAGSFDDSQGRSINTSNEADKTKANTTAKSGDSSAIESTNVRAQQEALDRFSNMQQDMGSDGGNRDRQELLQLANKALSDKSNLAMQLERLKDKQKAFKSKVANLEDKITSLQQSQKQSEERSEKQQAIIKKRTFEIEEMKMAIDEFQKSVKQLNTEKKRLEIANSELERKLKAERAERMSMSNNSFVSQGLGGRFGAGGGGGGGAARDILSQSILERSMAGAGNTSIMDLMTGHAAPSMKEIANRSMSISKPKEHSFVSSQKSFFSKKPAQLMASKQDDVASGTKKSESDAQYLISDGSFSSSDGGGVKKVEAFSDDNSEESEDSQDCVVETDTKIKSTGFFHKMRLRDIMKSKGQKKTEIFREGESDEYNSEVDGEPSIDMPEINYDLMGVLDKENDLHESMLKLVEQHEELPEGWEEQLTFQQRKKHHQRKLDEDWHQRVEEQGEDDTPEPRPLVDVNEITRDLLTSDQTFVFSDEMIIYESKILTTFFVIVEQKVYILYKESKMNAYPPFDIEEIAAVVMSPSNPMSAAFRMKDSKKFNRSHIIFQNQNMGLMIRFIQELEAYWLSVEFNDQLAVIIDGKPSTFNFRDIALEKQKDQNEGLVNCAAQGYLFKKKTGFAGYWRNLFSDENWESNFYVLTNVGILVFEEENFSNPTRLIPLGKLTVAPVSQKQAGKPFAFRLSITEEDEVLLRAPDRQQFDIWMKTLRSLIDELKKKPQNFRIT